MNDSQRKNEIRKALHYPLHKQGMMPSIQNPNRSFARFNSGGMVRSSYSGGIGRPVRGRRPVRGMRRPGMGMSPARYNTGGFVNSRTNRKPVRGRIRGRRNFTPMNRRTFRR